MASIAIFGRAPDRVLLSGKGTYLVTGELSGEVMVPQGAPGVEGKLTLWALGREQGRGRPVSTIGRSGHSGCDLVSRPFAAPDVLGLFLAGNYQGVDNQLFLRLEGTNRWQVLYVSHASKDWVMVRWSIPPDWRGRKIRIVARLGEMTPGIWIGVSAPLECSWISTLAHQITSNMLLPLFALHFLLFLLPGLLLTHYLGLPRSLGGAYSLLAAAALGALLGYGAFWVYFANHQYGFIFSSLVMAGSVVGFGISLSRRTFREFILDPDVIFPALIMFCVGLFYLALLLTMESTESTHDLARGRFITVLHGDNSFPMLFAEGLNRGLLKGAVRFGDFLSSDRPPLQVGILLLQRPIMELSPPLKDLHYQLIGTVAQLSWVPAVWTICRVARLPWPRIALVFCFCSFSGFFLFNSVHVWPKLLAGAMTVLAVCGVLEPPGPERSRSHVRFAVVGGAAALGMLAHGGSVFPSVILLVVLLLPRRFPGPGKLLVVGLVFACLMAPWFAYQKLYDPPGNRLVKWHLGGVKDTDKRSALETITQSYKRLGVTKALKHKLDNFTALFWQDGATVHGYRFVSMGHVSNPSILRGLEFLHVFWALGLLNLGWLLLAASVVFRRLRRDGHWWARGSLLFCLGSLLVWVLAMFGPGSTHVFQGSHATMILLFAGLGVCVTSAHRVLSYLLVAANAVSFSVVWVFTTPPRPPTDILAIPNLQMVCLAVLSCCGLLAVLWRLRRLHP